MSRINGKQWEVFLNDELIDTVWFTVACDQEYVKSSLINHDGLDPRIEVEEC